MKKLPDDLRILRVYADSVQIAIESRVRVQGRSNMTLLPDFFAIDVYNMPDEDLGKVRSSNILFVNGLDNSTICYGQIEDIFVRPSESNVVTTISISDGNDFWNAQIRKTIGRGAGVRESISAILKGAVLGSYLAENPRLIRGQTISGKQPEIIRSYAQSLNARAFLSHGVLHIVEKGKAENTVIIPESELIEEPSIANGVCILQLKVKGYAVGSMAIVRGKQYRIAAQSVDADNFSGMWRTELILVNEDMLSWMGG